MYCTKCGKKANPGDVYCSGCGSRLGPGSGQEKKQARDTKGSGNWLLLLIVIGVVGAFVGMWESSSAPEAPSGNLTASIRTEQKSTESLPQEPRDGDVLEESHYPNGNPRREVSDYGETVYVTDYRPDGMILRDTTLTYTSDGQFAAIRVTNYDDHGNPTDTTETESDGALWLYLYYENTYDDQGRPLKLVEYNRMGNPLCIYSYTYNSDGTYTMECTEYRGFVYEYDLEYNPQGTTSLWTHSITTFNQAGEPVDQYITMMDGSPVE